MKKTRGGISLGGVRMAKRWIVLCVICIAAGGLFITAYLHQKAIDECYIELSDDEIKTLFAETILRSPRNRSDLDNISVADFKEEAEWVIIQRDPVPRQEADSEYEMTLYEVYANLRGFVFFAYIDKCSTVATIGRMGD